MRVHLVAICGTGMGSLAGLLQEAGHQVRGSDQAFYPPMSESLQAWGIPTLQGFDPVHLEDDPDLVIVGNACRRDNPEALAARERGLAVKSFPQALFDLFIAGRTSVVVAGTHGKTTTSAMLSRLLERAGLDPSFLVGGIPLDFGKSFRLGGGEHFVVEGDEYDSAYFDKRPKFLHYRPDIAVLTSVEFDHADIYADMDAYRKAFRDFVGLVQAEGLLVACRDDPEVQQLLPRAAGRVITYGFSEAADFRATGFSEGPDGILFSLAIHGRPAGPVAFPLSGRHNVQNALAVLAVAEWVGIEPSQVSSLLSDYRGVARRMQVRGRVAGVTVLDDFAHHPTAVQETLAGARRRYPDSRLVAVFEPRTNTSRRAFFQERYAGSFAGADLVVVVPPYQSEKIPESERFDSRRLVEALEASGKPAVFMEDAGAAIEYLTAGLGPGSVVLIMSNGAFDDIHQRLLDALGQREKGV